MVQSRLVRRLAAAAFLLVLSAGTGLGGQTAAPLTLEAAVAQALSASPALAAARARRAVDAAGLALARERPNPDASIELERETPRQSFALALPVELGGKRARRVAVGEAGVRAGAAEIARAEAQIRSDVRRAYFEARVADARIGVLGEMRDVALRARTAAAARFDAGDAPRLEVLQAGLALSAAESDLVTAEAVAAAARSQLNALLGLAMDTRPPLVTPIDSGGPVVPANLVALARTAHAGLSALDRRIDEQKARVDLARALRVPDVVPTATLTRGSDPEFAYGWRASVGITLPVFTTHQAGVAVEQAALDQLLADRQALVARITGDVTAAALTAEAERLAYLRYRDDILPQAQQVEQLAQDAYTLGQTGIVSLLQALQASRDVRLRSLDAVARFQEALADLETALGAPLP